MHIPEIRLKGTGVFSSMVTMEFLWESKCVAGFPQNDSLSMADTTSTKTVSRRLTKDPRGWFLLSSENCVG